MKKLITIVCCLTLLSSMLVGCGDKKAADKTDENNSAVSVGEFLKLKVKLKDGKVKAEIYDKINKDLSEEYVSQADLNKIKSLEINYKQITDEYTSDISYLHNLEYLDLSYNEITNLSFLKDLKNLKQLKLEENKITDISFLKELPNLKHLALDHNPITDISQLKNLTNLEFLSLRNNQIKDISALKGLTKLTLLDVSENNISDVSVLSNFKMLTYLSIDNNPVTDVSPLKDLPYLETLTLPMELATDEIKAMFKCDLSFKY